MISISYHYILSNPELISKPDWHKVTENIDGAVTAVQTPHYIEDECFYIVDEIGVDAGSFFADPNMAYDTSKVNVVLITHAHEDHISGLKYYKNNPVAYILNDKYGYAKKNFTKGMKPYKDFTPLNKSHFDKDYVPNFDLETREIDSYQNIRYIKPYETFELAGHRIKAFPIAGHTPDGVAYFFVDKGWLFMGDNAYIGPLLFTQPESLLEESNFVNYVRDFILMYKEIRPYVTKVFPGHNHPVLDASILDVFFHAITHMEEAIVTIETEEPFGTYKKYDFSHIMPRLSFYLPVDFDISKLTDL